MVQALGIVCLDPGWVDISGKIRIFALDKTGTLTQPWLHFLGVQPVQSASTQTTHAGALTCVRMQSCQWHSLLPAAAQSCLLLLHIVNV